MKVIIGAGGITQPGWLSLEESDLDITQADQWAALFAPNSLDAIFAEHVWEHLTLNEAMAAARNCFAYLKPGGNLRIAVPDGFHTDPQYIAWVRPGTGWNGDDHKVLYNYISLCHLLTLTGFQCFPKEFFSEQGQLVAIPLDVTRGRVRRSVQTFASEWEGRLLGLLFGWTYSSLTVDALKPATQMVNGWPAGAQLWLR